MAASDVDEVVSVFVDAFRDYPVMSFVLGAGEPNGPGRTARLERLVRLFVRARVMRSEPLFGIPRGDGLDAAAIASFPERGLALPGFLEYRREVWRELGRDAEARYDAFGAATRRFDPGVPHVHLNMVGVRSGRQRKGFGGLLIDRVQRLSRERAGSEGISLTTEDPANVPYYESLGFIGIGHAVVGPGLETWGFFRPDAGGGQSWEIPPLGPMMHRRIEWWRPGHREWPDSARGTVGRPAQPATSRDAASSLRGHETCSLEPRAAHSGVGLGVWGWE